MRCYICDVALDEKTIVFNEELKQYEPCPVCLEAALEAAYTGGFKIENSDEVPDEDEGFVPVEQATLDPECYRSYFDHSDASLPNDIWSTDNNDD